MNKKTSFRKISPLSLFLLVAILILGTISMTPPAYALTTFGSTVNLSQNSGSSFNAQVAALGNNVYATWMDNTPGNFEIFFRKSTDGGATFGPAQQLTTTAASSGSPSIAVAQVGPNTHVYIAYTEEDAAGGTPFDQEVKLLRSTNDGASFAAPVNISNTPFTGSDANPVGASSSPYVAAASNFVFVAWQEVLGVPNSEIFLRRSIDAGANFQSSVQISSTSFFSFFPRIALNLPNVHIAWNDNGNGAPGAVGGLGETFYRRSTTNGNSYDPQVDLSSNTDFSLGADIAVSGSNVHVVWAEHTLANVPTQVVYKRSTTNGSSFGATTTLSALSQIGSQQAFTGIAALGSNVFVVFNDVSGGNQEIFFMESSDNGTTFSSAADISNNSGESNFADIAASSVHVTWYDNTPGNFDIFYITSTVADTTAPTGSVVINGGAAFTNDVTVTLTLTCSDTGSGCTQMQIAVDGTADTELFESFTTTRTAVLSAIDGTKTIAVRFKDAAGNVSAQLTDSIVLDTTAPTLTTPADIVTNTDPGQPTAVVNYALPTATDNAGVVDVTCSPPSGSTFPVGTTTITCTATDAVGNTATASFTVTVVDTTPPVITLLGSPTVTLLVGEAYSDAGATAFDNVNGDLTSSIVTVNPVDTSTAGTYTITYGVSDSAGNTAAQVTRTVVVLSPAQASQNLIGTVQSLGLPQGTANSLISKLDATINSLNNGQNTAAENQLNAFINQVNAKCCNNPPSKPLTTEQANQLIAAANNIINVVP